MFEQPTQPTPEQADPRKELRRQLLEKIARQNNAYLSVSMAHQWQGHQLSGAYSTGPGFQDILKAGTKLKHFHDVVQPYWHHLIASDSGRERERSLSEKNIFEEVRLMPVTNETFENVSVRKSRTVPYMIFSTKTEEYTDTVRRSLGKKPVLHQDMQPGGVAEPAYYLVYRTVGAPPNFIDYSGRGGNFLRVVVALPETLAKQSIEEIRQNPQFAREIAKTVAMTMDITPEQWKTGDANVGTPVRPPYDTWETKGGSSIIIVEPGKPEQVLKISH